MNSELIKIREQIDQIDDAIVDLFERRLALSADAAVLKRQLGLQRVDVQREQAIIKRQTARVGEPVAFYVPLLFDAILELSRTYQVRVLDDDHAVWPDR